MALTGLQIYKLLPQTNCKECGFPTCLAFAMKLAQKGTELDKCPYVSDEAKTALDAASAPPIKLVTIGAGERAFEVGNETVMFRHEKTFVHQPGLVVRVKSDDRRPRRGGGRVGRLQRRARRHDARARRPRRGARRRRRGRVRRGRGRGPRGRSRPAAGAHERRRGGDRRGPGRRRSRREAAHPRRHRGELAGDGRGRQEARLPAGHPRRGRRPRRPRRALRAGPRRRRRGPRARPRHDDPRRRPRRRSRSCAAWRSRRARGRSAIPIVAVAAAPTWQAELVRATQAVGKYAGVIILDHFEPAMLYSLLTLRQNIYTDPQKPIQMEPKLYEIGAVDRRQPGAHHDQLLAHLLLGGGRGRGRRHPAVAARRRQRRPVGAHRLGGRQVRRREDRQDGQGLRHRAEGQPQEAGHPRPRGRALGRGRGGAARAGRSWSARATPSTSPTTSRTSGAHDAERRACHEEPRTAMATITFTPSGETIEVPHGTSLLDAAILCELDVPAPCAGQGRCGRCRVRVASGEVERRSNAGLATAEILDGWAVACQTYVGAGAVEVEVPERAQGEGAPARPRHRRAGVAAHHLRLPAEPGGAHLRARHRAAVARRQHQRLRPPAAGAARSSTASRRSAPSCPCCGGSARTCAWPTGRSA